jgi:hypothetical protein
MQLPTMSLRVAPEYQQLIRDIGLALRTRPGLGNVLRDVLQSQYELRDVIQTQHDGVTERNTDVLQRILERLAIEEEVSRTNMTFVQGINDRLKALERSKAFCDTDGNTDVFQPILDRLAALEAKAQERPAEPEIIPVTSGLPPQPEASAASNRPIPAEHLEEAARLWDGGKGPSIPQIIKSKGWPYNRSALHKAVKRYLDQSLDQAEPVSHVDENPEPPTESATD